MTPKSRDPRSLSTALIAWIVSLGAILVGVLTFFANGTLPHDSITHAPQKTCSHPASESCSSPIDSTLPASIRHVQPVSFLSESDDFELRDLELRVLNEEAHPVAGAIIRHARSVEALYARDSSSESVSAVSDESGWIKLNVESSGRTSFLVTADGYLSELIGHTFSKDGPKDVKERVITLVKPREIEVHVTTVDRVPVPGAQVDVFGRWGREAEALERRAGTKWLSNRLYEKVTTDGKGIARVLVHPQDCYEIGVDRFGYEPQSIDFESGGHQVGQVEVTLFPLMAAGIQIPNYSRISGSLRVVRGAFNEHADGLSRARLSAKHRRKTIEELNTRIGLEDVYWILAVDRRGSVGREPVTKEVLYRHFLGAPQTRTALEFKRVADEIGPWDIAKSAPTEERLVEVLVEFQDAQGKPASPGGPWGLVKGSGFSVMANASGLQKEDRPDISAGRTGFLFRVPEGEYSIKVIEPLLVPMRSTEFEPVRIHASGYSRTHLVTLNETNARVRVECTDTLGRRIDEFSVIFYRKDAHGFPRDERHRVSLTDGAMKPISILGGRCHVDIEAFGYVRRSEACEFVAGQDHVLRVELDFLFDESQNPPRTSLDSLDW